MYSAKFKWEIVSYDNSHIEDAAWLDIPEMFSSLEIKALKDNLFNYFNENKIKIENIYIEVPGKVRNIKIETPVAFNGNENWLYFNNYTRWLNQNENT